MQDIKAVVFDLGETLVNYGIVDLRDIFRQGARLTYDFLKQQFGAAAELPSFRRYHLGHFASIRWHVLKARLSGREFDCLALLERHIRKMGLPVTHEQLQELAWLWYQPLQKCASVEIGIHEHLQTLKDMSLKFAIVSNTFLPGAVLDRHLQQLDLLRFFPIRLYSSETVIRKPHPKIFQNALRQLEVSASAAVMIGDNLAMDIKGAYRAGLSAVLKRAATNRTQRVRQQIPVIERIAELPALLGSWSHKDVPQHEQSIELQQH